MTKKKTVVKCSASAVFSQVFKVSRESGSVDVSGKKAGQDDIM